VVTDVGSRDGDLAIACKRACPDSRVYAFEANPENFFEFAETACREGVVFVPLAIGAARETIELHVPDWASAQNGASRQFRGIGSARPRTDTGEHLVYRAPAVPLGEFFALPEHRDATFAHWIDVEGCSYDVLRGFTPWLAERTMFLKIEVETKAFWRGQRLVTDCIELCAELGLEPCAWFDHAEQFDIVFVNEARVAACRRRPAHRPCQGTKP
jgi:FkbM family methyltransferase